MPSAAAMSELWRPFSTGRMVRLSLRAFRPGTRTDRGRRTAVARHTRPRAAASGWGPPIWEGVDITVEHLARHTSGLPRSPQGLSLRAVWAAGTRGRGSVRAN
jgi:hypothetical protein